MNKLLIIGGPTATGKTVLGIELAKSLSSKRRPASGWNGEIVSADSRQVYRGMDVGTGKDLPENVEFRMMNNELGIKNRKQRVGYYLLDEIPVWLYDVVGPKERFSVADYIQVADLVVEDIRQREKLPIIIGGTGFYIKGLVEGIGTIGMKPNWELRKELQSDKVLELQKKLKKLNPEKWKKMNESDRKNSRRLIRAIEIAYHGIRHTTYDIGHRRMDWEILWIGLKAPNEFLYQRIDERVDERVGQGIEKEIKQLLKKGCNWKNSVLGSTLGYREWQAFFEGQVTKKEVIQKWKFNEHGYARRQMTWFKKRQGVHWFDIAKWRWQNKVEKLIKRWYSGR